MRRSRSLLLPVLAAAAFTILGGAGCSSRALVARSRMVPGTVLGKTQVFVSGGQTYEFRRVSFAADSLVGESEVSVEKESERDGIYYVNETHRYPIALATVDSMRVFRRDPGKTVLFGAGIAAAVAFVIQVTDTGGLGKRSSSGGKYTSPP